MPPKLSAPLAKLIRTGEGIVLFAFNAAATTLAVIGDVSPSTALKYAAVFNAVAFASRQVLKAAAALRPIVGDPITPTALSPLQSALAAVLAEAAALKPGPAPAPPPVAAEPVRVPQP